MLQNSPCFTCDRVKDPQNCENKNCRVWQTWYIARWESMRDAIRKEMAQARLRELGIPLGGERYASPHRVRSYLQTDPCTLCPCGSCAVPCPVRKTWNEKRGACK